MFLCFSVEQHQLTTNGSREESSIARRKALVFRQPVAVEGVADDAPLIWPSSSTTLDIPTRQCSGLVPYLEDIVTGKYPLVD